MYRDTLAAFAEKHQRRTRLPSLRRKGFVRGTLIAFAASVPILAMTFWTIPKLAAKIAAPVARTWLGDLPLGQADESSLTVVDRQDRLLRAFTTDDGRWRLPVNHTDVDQRYLRMLVAFEDRRFYQHAGVDVLALMRAGGQFARNGRIVSGASTLTMQAVRLLEGRHQRTGSGKLRQIGRALQLEAQRDKHAILDLYLKLAPFGGNIEGVRAASLTYFGKEPKRLSVAEAALLIALPQSPEARRPDRHPIRARAARDRVLDRLVGAGVLSAIEAAQAKTEQVPDVRRDFPKLAPHLAEAEVSAHPAALIHRLTLDRDIQQAMEALALEHVRTLGQRLSTAILVVDHASGDVLAHVGAADYFDETRFGSIDMVRAVRSPGSTLKPFIYGLAFEKGLAHPETLIEDKPTRFGGYVPKNFDQDFHGTVTIREALQLSLNIPAVKVLAAVGPQALVGRFRRVGITSVLPDHAEPALPIALGGVGLRLTDLAALYAGVARGGEAVRLSHRMDDHRVSSATVRSNRLLDPVAAWYVTSMLAGTPAPEGAKAGDIAYKTGTSYGYRDAWSVGYDGRVTIAVWVGRPDGAATPGLTGRWAAAPILFDAFQRLGRRLEPLPGPPSGAIAGKGTPLPPPLRRFRGPNDDAVAGLYTDPPVQIAFPPDRAELEVEDDGSASTGAAAASATQSQIMLKAEGGALPLTWLADGKPLSSIAHAREVLFAPAGKGFVRLSVIDAKGRADHVTVRLR